MQRGHKIGRYEIIRKLGEGGMGEVFLAHDESLDREVAIKVLLPEFCCNLERVNRFKLEARAASSLNHPSIITIFEVGTEDDKLYIVTEYIEGETLRSLIERQKLDLATTLSFVSQIASALVSAHKAGIIHRDIKPENLMVREDGIIKLLDFGLAKPTLVESEAETRELVSTRAGVVLGSVAYMSPEQARGKEVDARTDLWSLGVCTYEMLAGATPFDGETMTDILANIIHKDPVQLTHHSDDFPLELHRIVKKSLRKNRDERYPSAKDFLVDIRNLMRDMNLMHETDISLSPDSFPNITAKNKEILTDKTKIIDTDEVAKSVESSSQTASDSERPAFESANFKQKRSMFKYAAIGLILLSGLAYFSTVFRQKMPATEAFLNSRVEKIPVRGKLDGIEVSPDGKYLVYTQNLGGAKAQLMLRQVETGSEKDILPLDEGLIKLVGFSPDGNYVYYRKYAVAGLGASLFRVPTLGGDVKQIAFDVDSGVSFSPDGRQIVFHRHKLTPSSDEIILMSADGGEEKVILTSNSEIMNPQFSPDGATIAITVLDKSKGVGQPSFRLGSFRTDNPAVTNIGSQYFTDLRDYRWLSDGSGLVASGVLGNENSRQIYAIGFPNGEITGITKDVNDYFGISLTADNKKLVAVQASTVTGIWEYDFAAKRAKQISTTSDELKGFTGLDNLPDGGLVFTKFDGKDSIDLWKLDTATLQETPIIRGRGENRVRFISNDGKSIFFESIRNGSDDIWRMNADGSNEAQLTKTPDLMESICGITPDNKFLIYRRSDFYSTNAVLIRLNLETGETKTIWQNEKFLLQNAVLSPDAKSVLYTLAPIHIESGIMPQASLYIASFDGEKLGEPRLLENVVGGRGYRFSPDGKTLYFTEVAFESTDLWQMDVASGKKSKVTNFNLESIFRFAISKDGKKAYFVRGNSNREVILIENQS